MVGCNGVLDWQIAMANSIGKLASGIAMMKGDFDYGAGSISWNGWLDWKVGLVTPSCGGG